MNHIDFIFEDKLRGRGATHPTPGRNSTPDLGFGQTVKDGFEKHEVSHIVQTFWKKSSSANEGLPGLNEVLTRQFAEDKWEYKEDMAFTMTDMSSLLHSMPNAPPSPGLICDRCAGIDLEQTTLNSFNVLSKTCILCQKLSQLQRTTAEESERNLEILHFLRQVQHDIRICAIPESGNIQHQAQQKYKIWPGLPKVLQSGSRSHFDLIRKWLDLCQSRQCLSRSQDTCGPNLDDPEFEMPKRVIDVTITNKGRPYFVCLSSKQDENTKYVALSHRWGDLSPDQKAPWRLSKNNENEWHNGFEMKESTFRDAITVTRELGIKYLWIDSFCIIQDDKEEFNEEARKMEKVFKLAWLTIAATSSKDLREPFLCRETQDMDEEYAIMSTNSHGNLYVSKRANNFSEDVLDGTLNKRAWVLQERALSRRTIPFTKSQTYWECGGGVRCETLGYMTNGRVSIESDPNFPHSLVDRYLSPQVDFFQMLFSKYTSLGIWYHSDRSIAIDSLCTALAKTLETKVYYGIFGDQELIQRSLLWYRATNPDKAKNSGTAMMPIDYADQPPSWSWMARFGKIAYPKLSQTSGERVGLNPNLEISEEDSKPVGNDPKTRRLILKAFAHDINVEESCFSELDYKNEDGSVRFWFDTYFKPTKPLKIAIVVRVARIIKYTYWVLAIAEREGGHGYERVGIGAIKKTGDTGFGSSEEVSIF